MCINVNRCTHHNRKQGIQQRGREQRGKEKETINRRSQGKEEEEIQKVVSINQLGSIYLHIQSLNTFTHIYTRTSYTTIPNVQSTCYFRLLYIMFESIRRQRAFGYGLIRSLLLQ